MWAQQLVKAGPIETEPLAAVNGADPAPGSDELLVEVAACGVCRTDLQIVEGDLHSRALPIVPGHQVVGRVVALGEGVTDWSIGERIGVGWLGGACGTCSHCAAGAENLCESAEFTGWDRNGGYADRMLVRSDFGLRLPDAPSDVELAPLLCGGVIGYRALKISGIQPGEKLGLFGFGASASLAIQVASHWGCEVFVVTRSESEQARARSLGAAWAGGYGEPIPEPLNAAVTFAPAGDVVVAALRALDRGGTVAINAIHLDRIPQFDYDLLWWERQIRSVANYTREDAREFLALATEIPITTAVDEYPLGEANIALDRLKGGETTGTAVLIPDRKQ